VLYLCRADAADLIEITEKHGAQRLPCDPLWPNPYPGYTLACAFFGPATGAVALVLSAGDLREAKFEPGDKAWLRVPTAYVKAAMPWIADQL